MARRALTPADRRKRVLDHLAARGAKGATAGELREYTGGGGMKAAEFRQVLEPLVAGGLVTAAVGAILWGRGWTREAVIYRIAGEGTHDHESPE